MQNSMTPATSEARKSDSGIEHHISNCRSRASASSKKWAGKSDPHHGKATAATTKEDRPSAMPTPEKVGRHHLETDDREAEEDDAHTFTKDGPTLIVRETGHRQARRQFADQESERGDAGSADDRQFQHPIHPPELPGTVIIPSNGLHTLIDAHDDHHGRIPTDDDTVSTDIEIAVLLESLVDQNHDETSRKVHLRRRHADSQHITHDLAFQPVDAAPEMQISFPSEKMRNRQTGASICASTGRNAAPRMPQPKPKMNSGSRIALIVTVRIVAYIALRGCPAARATRRSDPNTCV